MITHILTLRRINNSLRHSLIALTTRHMISLIRTTRRITFKTSPTSKLRLIAIRHSNMLKRHLEDLLIRITISSNSDQLIQKNEAKTIIRLSLTRHQHPLRTNLSKIRTRTRLKKNMYLIRINLNFNTAPTDLPTKISRPPRGPAGFKSASEPHLSSN